MDKMVCIFPLVRFEVYVCTAAERPYALEVWRLLDTKASLIPLDQRSQRIVNVKKKKSLLETVGVIKPKTTAPSKQPSEQEAAGEMANSVSWKFECLI
jgi:hypothetical protein